MIRFLERCLNDQPDNEADSHRWWKVLPVRLTTGQWSRANGQLWRRRTASGWEYQQDAESEDEHAETRW